MAQRGRPKGTTKIFSQDAFRNALNKAFSGPTGFAERILAMADSENPNLRAKGMELAVKYVFGVPPQEHSGLDGGPIELKIVDTSGMRD